MITREILFDLTKMPSIYFVSVYNQTIFFNVLLSRVLVVIYKAEHACHKKRTRDIQRWKSEPIDLQMQMRIHTDDKNIRLSRRE